MTDQTRGSDRPVLALVFGGDSGEHPISCLTAASVANTVDPEHYDLIGIGITRSGRWVQMSAEAVRALAVHDRELPSVPDDLPDAVIMRGDGGARVATRRGDQLVDERQVDVAFALLHGPFGEDGTIQGLFEMNGVRYVGSGVTASAVGMDKHVMKLVLGAQGIPQGHYLAVSPRQWREERPETLAKLAELRFPVFVKPARGGSSLGITRVESPEGLDAAILEAQRHDPKILVEEGFVDCREIECGVLEDPRGGKPHASGLGEIRMHTDDAFYDFEAKYLPDEQVTLDVPARVDPEVSEKIRALAIRTFEALDGEGLARIDFFVTPDGDAFVNEVNTMPGFTALSMFPMMWRHSGVDYPELIDWLVELARNRPLGLR